MRFYKVFGEEEGQAMTICQSCKEDIDDVDIGFGIIGVEPLGNDRELVCDICDSCRYDYEDETDFDDDE